ncbi:ABC transporter permease [Spiroplasma clarkii]|uniref:FtsX-like permease family protein n=1 Tax=Spiroplasma clarkii TaxID=2139 RepID=UPI000B55E5B8|nr:FtsX-like permease family protein [Spiroplasma clarkii]ARU92205.1 ABC transporter permease [Spiroplasma clarkii]
MSNYFDPDKNNSDSLDMVDNFKLTDREKFLQDRVDSIQGESLESESAQNSKKTSKKSQPDDKPPKYKQLILKAGFKNTLKNLGQLIGLGFLVTSALILGLFSITTASRIQAGYKDLQTASVQHDFVVDMNNTTRIYFNQDQWIGGENIDNYSSQDLFEQYLINVLSRKGITNDNGQIIGDSLFTWSRTEARTFRNLKNGERDLNVKVVSKTGHVDETYADSKVETVNVDKIVLSNESQDKMFSTDKVKAEHEVILQPNFAKANGIKRGDIVRLTPDNYGSQLLLNQDIKDLQFGGSTSINDDVNGIDNSIYKDQPWFQVIGFGTSIDFTYPITNAKTKIPSAYRDLVAYVDPGVFGLKLETIKSEPNEQFKIYSSDLAASKLTVDSESDKEVFFSGKFKNKSANFDSYLKAFNREWVRYGNLNTENIKLFYSIDDTEYQYYYRIAAYNQVIWAYWVFSIMLVMLLAIIATFTIVLIVKKQIDEAKTKLGTFKALGYSNFKLMSYFVSLPIVISVVGFVIAYILILSLQNIYVNLFGSYFSVLFRPFDAIAWQAFLVFFLVLGLMSLITLIIAYLVIEQSALTLLQGNLAKKNTFIGRGVKRIFARANPNIKLHVALLIGSTGKILATATTLLVSTVLISAVTIMPTVMEKNNQGVFAGLDYDDVVEYTEPISNNPATFMKTYNPNNDETWSYNQNNKVTDISEVTNSTQQYMTAYPLIYNRDNSSYEYDSKTILHDLMSNNINSNYYSYNIPVIQDDNFLSYYEIARNNYTNWKVLSTEYLQKLDELEIPDREAEGVPYNAIATITNQWLDYKYLMNDIERFAIALNSRGTTSGVLNAVKSTANELQNFYKKYVNGIPIHVNDKYLNTGKTALDLNKVLAVDYDEQLYELSTNQIYSDLEVKTPLKLASVGKANQFYGSSLRSGEEDNQKRWNSLVSEFVKTNFDFDSHTLEFGGEDIAKIDLNESSFSLQDYQNFNTNLILWYWIHFESKLGTVLMEATYQNSNNTVQQNMVSALEQGISYNISTNIVPYDETYEELGTMLNGTFHTNTQELNLKVYGLGDESSAVELKDHSGQDIKANLFKNLADGYKNYVPIIINRTVAEKMQVGVRDTMDISIMKKVLVDGENQEIGLDDVKMGVQKKYNYQTQTTNNIIAEGRKNYFAYNSTNSGWNSQSQIQTAAINGHSIASKSIDGINKDSEIQTAANDSKIKKTFIGKNKEFVIVGITENYGESKAWISNDNANKILGYDQIKNISLITSLLMNEEIVQPY